MKNATLSCSKCAKILKFGKPSSASCKS